jgi:5'-nucleotidase (lipoprotein e(P4) family)
MNSPAIAPLAAALVSFGLAIGSAQAQSAPVPQNDLLNATLWVSNSVEFKANAISMYQLAKIRLDEALADKTWSATGQTDAADKPLAIIADMDETLLDNGGYESWLVKAGKDYSGKTYDAWTKAQAAKAVPGALEFYKYADSKGVKVFYLSNRGVETEKDTRANMEKLGFPMGGNVDTFLMQNEKPDWGSAKSTRRAVIAKDYRIMLNFGDNFGDFDDRYKLDEAGRLKAFEEDKDRWGREWLVIANPTYGSFESATFGHDFKKSKEDQRKAKWDALEAWSGPKQ